MFEFDWHARKEDFVKWMFVHLISDRHSEDPQFEKLSAATDKFRNVQLTMQVNGIEVNAQNFIECVESAIKQHAEKATKEIVADSVPYLDDLQDTIYTAQKAITEKLKTSLRNAGITWNEDD